MSTIKARLPAGTPYLRPRARQSNALRVEQLAKVIDVLGLVIADTTPPETRGEVRRRLHSLAREAAVAQEPAVMGAFDRVAQALSDDLPPWVQRPLFQ